MPICPNCKEEYREGFSTCSDCGETLVEKGAEPQADKPEDGQMVFVETVRLCYIADDVNADILVAALKESKIPTLVKRPEAGGYLTIYMGMNTFGVEIYVPPDMLDDAQEIFDSVLGCYSDSAEDCDEEFEAMLRRDARNKLIKGWLLFALLFGIPMLLSILINHIFAR